MTPNFSKPVALFGGSFDPVHQGHLYIAQAVRQALPEHQIIFIPTAQSPGKASPLAPARLRIAWLEAAIREYGFQFWECEIKRGGTSYTIDTLEEAKALGAKREHTVLVLGADSYKAFPQWRDPDRIRSIAKLVVINREGISLPPPVMDDIILKIPTHPASSTAVRKALAANEPIAGLLPPEVYSDLEKLTLLQQNPYARKKE